MVFNLIGKVVGAFTGANTAARAARDAANTQAASAQAGIDEQRRQFDAIVDLMRPFVTGGQGAFAAQGDLLGLGGADRQQAAISGIEGSPLFQSLVRQGEDALLQNASATGGLRGGNTQAALAEFRPAMLNSQIQQQFNNLGGLSQLGQASAAGQASAGLSTGQAVSGLLQQQGAARAGGQLTAGNLQAQSIGQGVGGILRLIGGGF